jgi:hypothetical protein
MQDKTARFISVSKTTEQVAYRTRIRIRNQKSNRTVTAYKTKITVSSRSECGAGSGTGPSVLIPAIQRTNWLYNRPQAAGTRIGTDL